MALNFGFGGGGQSSGSDGGSFGFFQSSKASQGLQKTKRIETASVLVATDESGDFCDIQEAINSLYGIGGHVFIKEGTFQSNVSIKIPSNVTITGTGYNTTIERTTAGDVIINKSGATGNNNIEIKNVRVLGVNSGTYSGFYFKNCENVLLTSVFVETLYYGVYFEGCEKFSLLNSIIIEENIGEAVFLENSDFGSILNNHLFGENACVGLDNSEHNIINGNQCNDTASVSIEIYNDSHYNVVSSNICYNSAAYGIYVAGDYNIIEGNVCDHAFSWGIIIISGATKNIVNENMAKISNSGTSTTLQDNITI